MPVHVNGTELSESQGTATPTTSAVGASAAAGNSARLAKSDHVHGREGFQGTPSTQAHDDSSSPGNATAVARGDHKHGMPAGGGIDSGTIAFFTNSCPDGWSEYTAARGRYIVGTPSGGSATATVGTAMSDKENRAVGNHNHSIGCAHGNMNTGHGDSNYPAGLGGGGSWSNNVISNTGGVADTNAPYVQLICCVAD